MSRIFITGDIHGNHGRIDLIKKDLKRYGSTKEDYLIFLGDVGANFYGNLYDKTVKGHLNRLPITCICMQGNHDKRPKNIETYTKHYDYNIQCAVWTEEEFPYLLFPEDGEMIINNKLFLVLGGAYSIDKNFRIANNWPWFEDEQMSEEDKERILRYISTENSYDYILSHCAPLIYEPKELFLPQIDQSTVDKTMENFLQKVYEQVEFKTWFFGHYHKDYWVQYPKARLVYEDIIEIPMEDE